MKFLYIFFILLIPIASSSGFHIETDKLNYYGGETIHIEIFPKERYINLTYAGESIFVKNEATFEAVKYQNRIIATFENREDQIIINIVDEENEEFAFNLASVSFVFYIIYGFLKNYIPRLI